MIRVFLADDHAVLRAGVRALLEGAGDVAVVGETALGAEVLRRAASEAWDVLVLDLTLRDMTGFDVLRRVKEIQPTLAVLILTMHTGGSWAARLFQAGASGFVTKGHPAAAVLEAVRKVHAGGRGVRDELAALGLGPPAAAGEPAHASLTREQLEILARVGRGGTTVEIAAALGLSASAVSTHLQRIKTALGMRTTGELAQYARRAGLVP